MKAQNELEIYVEILCNIIQNGLKNNNNDGIYTNNKSKINNYKNQNIKNDIIKETNNNIIKNNISILCGYLIIIKSFYNNIFKIFIRKSKKKIVIEKKIKEKKKLLININKTKIIMADIYFIFLLIINYLILINFINIAKGNGINYGYSKIYLKIKGNGKHYILGNGADFNFEGINFLKEVYINGNKQNTIDYIYDFNQTDNYVKLIWDDNITNCNYMFYFCLNIIQIDLSHFNTSQVTQMNSIQF